jgi:hypothetical protein
VIPLYRPERKFFPVNRWLQRKAMLRLEKIRQHGPLLFADSREGLAGPAGAGLRFLRIDLVHPRAAALQHANPAFRIVKHSVFESRPESSCDVIRTMNIFNRGYFSEDRLREGARAVWRSLRTGGIWLAGRTAEESPGRLQTASLFEKTADRFSLISRADAPSEIEDLVLTLKNIE